jgi:hypothetical protein
MLSTAEGTVQIVSAGIAGMSEKPNSTMTTASDARLQIVIVFHGFVERVLMLLNERDGAILSMPIGTKRETFRQRDDKNARFSVMIRMLLDISSSYPLEADASRGRMRIFYARSRMICDERLRSPHLFSATQSFMLSRSLQIYAT